MSENSKKTRPRRKALALGLIMLGAFGLLAYMILVPKVIEVDSAVVTRGLFIQDIRAEGYFRSKEIHLLSAFAQGDLIERVTVKVGERVRKGQALATLYWDRKLVIRSPIDGVITKVFRDNIGPINRGEPIVEIMDPKKLEVVAELLTTDAVKVKVGDPVIISGWGGQASLTGKIVRVSKAGFIKPSALGVEEERTEVITGFEQLPEEVLQQIGSHFHTELRIEINRIEDALKFPVGALLRQGEGWAVFQIIGDRAVLTPVLIGLRNNDEVVVEQGLAEGARVIVYPGEEIHNKARVIEKARDSAATGNP